MEEDQDPALSGRDSTINVLASFVASLFAATIFLLFGVLLKQLKDSFGISTFAVSLIYFAQWLAFGVTSVALGAFSDRIAITRSVHLGLLTIVAGLGLAWVSFGFVTFLVGFGLMTGAGLSATFGPMHNLVLTTTAEKWRGTALGVVMVAQGIGPFVFVPIIAAMTHSMGPRAVTGILALAAAVTLLLSLFLREGEAGKDNEASDGPTWHSEELTSSANVRVTAAHLLGCASHTIPLVFVVDYLTKSAGLSLVAASSVLAVISLASSASRLGSPILGNVWGGVRTLAATLPLQVVGILLFVLFANSRSMPLYYLAASVFGLGFGAEMVLFSLVARQVFPGQIGLLLGVQLLGAAIGMGGGVLIAAVLLEAHVSYSNVFLVGLGLGVLGEILTVQIPHERASAPAQR